MKYFKILSILIFSCIISFYSCKDKDIKETTNQETKQPLKLLDGTNEQGSTSQNSGSIWHYTCNNGCAGGAAAAGNCSTCGNPLAHNQAYHNNTNNAANKTPTSPVTSPTSPTTTPTPEPSQNAAGVWHYTCSQGCAGGAGSASVCGTCGNTLVHNSAYH